LIIINMIDNSFKLDMLLGTGGSSKVYSCYDPTGELYAVKIIRKDKKFSNTLAKSLLETEINIMQEMYEHPNILNGYSLNTEGVFEANGKFEQIMYCIIELAKKGTIKTFIRRSGCLEENICRFYAIQIANAVAYLHSKDYAHMDVKVDNILLEENFNCKLADMGTCVKTQNGMTTRRCGTKQYMAPEMLEGHKETSYSAFKSDAYSLGVTIYVMLTGKFPNSNESTTLTNDSSCRSVDSDTTKEDILLSCISDECKDLLERLLSVDPAKRPSVTEILEHPWLANTGECVSPSDIFLEMKAREDYIVGNHATCS